MCEIYISEGSFIYNVLLLGFFENSVFSLEICLVMLIFEFNLRLFLISVWINCYYVYKNNFKF